MAASILQVSGLDIHVVFTFNRALCTPMSNNCCFRLCHCISVAFWVSHSVSGCVTRVRLTQRKDRDKTFKVL